MVNFINGCATVKVGRKVVARVYDQPIFFAGKSVSINPALPYSLELRIVADTWRGAAFATMEELMPHLQKHLGMDYGKI